MLRRIIYFMLVTVLLGGIGAGIAYYAFDFKPKFLAEVIMNAPKPAQTVSAEPARTDAWAPEITAIGSLTAPDSIDITPQVGGVIEQVLYESGQQVKKGDKLVVFDTATEEAELRSAEAQLTNAQDEFTRRNAVFKKGYAAKADVETLRMQRDTTQANVDRLHAVIAQKIIYAPWDGRLGFKNVSPGQYLAPGQPVVSLQSIDPIFADFTVTEAELGRIQKGQPVEARFDAFPDQAFQGKIALTDIKITEASRSIMVRAEIANPDRKLLPGMYANIKVTVGEPQTVTTVPQTAVTFSLYGDNVYVVVPAKKPDPNAKEPELEIERRFVKTGEVKAGRVAVVSGVKPGEQVVIAGQNKIDQGSKVKIDNSIALNRTEGPVLQ
jgi:membrane fusion protein (multidrug efflux system)